MYEQYYILISTALKNGDEQKAIYLIIQSSLNECFSPSFDIPGLYPKLCKKIIPHFTINFLNEVGDKFTVRDWRHIISKVRLTENIMEKYNSKISWDIVFLHQRLSEKFIEKFSYLFDWTKLILAYHNKLSYECIRKHKDEIDWYELSFNKNLTPEFVKEFSNEFRSAKFSINSYLNAARRM